MTNESIATSRSIAMRSLPWIVLAIGLSYLAFRLWTSDLIDLSVYRMGGERLLHGPPLYDEADGSGLPFTYPPFSAMMFVPLALMPFGAAQWVWTGICLLLLYGVTRLCADELPRLLGRPASWTSLEITAGLMGIGMLLEPIWATFSFGQVNLLLMWMVLFDGIAVRRGRGILTGLAAGIKIVPGIFVLFMLLTRRWKDFYLAAAAGIATVAVGFLVIPAQAWKYWTELATDESRVGAPNYAGNQSLNGLVLRVFGVDASKAIWLGIVLIAACAGLWAATVLWSRSRLLALVTVGLVALLASPISWNHHWVWMLPITFVLWAVGIRARAAQLNALGWSSQIVSVLMVAIGISGPIWWTPHGDQAEQHLTVLQNIEANSYVLTGIAALAVIVWIAALRSRLFLDEDSSLEAPMPQAA